MEVAWKYNHCVQQERHLQESLATRYFLCGISGGTYRKAVPKVRLGVGLGLRKEGSLELQLTWCPDFSWDRVNFHKKLGGGTARTADRN